MLSKWRESSRDLGHLLISFDRSFTLSVSHFPSVSNGNNSVSKINSKRKIRYYT